MMDLDPALKSEIPAAAQAYLLADAARRDRTTARRTALFSILWGERFLTRQYLIVRVEALLGEECFGQSAWEDTFYRDMCVVKDAFTKAGFCMRYSRRKSRQGYYLQGERGDGIH
jgi:hypothetical protein